MRALHYYISYLYRRFGRGALEDVISVVLFFPPLQFPSEVTFPLGLDKLC